MAYKLINIYEYLIDINKKYNEKPQLWYKTILPKEKADELIKLTNGNYSLIWHEHCINCWETISSNVKCCYYDEENNDWLCEKCYNSIK